MKRAKAEKIGRYVAMFAMPLLMVGMMITGYLGAMHAPTPHNMPIVVAGQSQDAEQFAATVEAAIPDAVNVSTVGSADEARQLVLDREVSGAVVLAGGSATLYTAGGAGATQSSTVTKLIAPLILADGLTLQSEDLAPLPENDVSGLGAMFLATALVMAGYLPFSMALSNSPELLRFRRAVPLLAGWAALVAALVWAVTGPLLGVVQGHGLAVVGIAWLGVFAIGSVQLFLTRILGPMAVLAAMLLLMVLGQPASNLAMSVYTMPEFFTVLHSFLPTPAIGEALRSVLYFDGAGVGKHLVVLAIGAVAGLLLTLGFDANKRRKNKNPVPTMVNMPALHGGRRPKTRRWRYGTLLFFPLAMVAMMVTFMLAAMNEPTPRDMPIAVAGATVEQADQAVAGLDEQMSGLFDLQVVRTADEAREQVQDRTVVAALVLPSAESPSATLFTNQAAGASAQQVVTAVFGQVAAGMEVELTIEDVAPLAASDSAGSVSMYLAMGWIMAGFMIIVVGANAAPASRPLRKLLPILAGWSVFMSAVLWLIAGPITGAVDGHFWPLFGTGIVAIFCVALFTTVFERLIGLLAILPVIAILMFVGIPSSGGAMSIYLEPEIFRVLHSFLPMPAAVESVRSILYFGGDTVGQHLLTLGIWGVLSLMLVLIIDRFKTVRTETEVVEAHGAAPRPGSVPASDTAGDAADDSADVKELLGV